MTTSAPDTALDELRPALLAMAADAVRMPSMPVAAFLGEARRILAYVDAHGLAAPLGAVGVDAEVLAQLAQATAALTRAEARWQVARDGTTPRELAAREVELSALRSRIVAAIRFNLPDDERADAVADAVMEGTGLGDLAMDLQVLAALLRSRPDGFARDATFDPAASASAAEEGAAELSNLHAVFLARASDRSMLDLRNRAFTHADALLRQVRRAGRYAFRDQPDHAAAFHNRWNVRRVRRSRSAAVDDASE